MGQPRSSGHPDGGITQRSPLKSDAQATDQEQCAVIRSLRRESAYGGGMSVIRAGHGRVGRRSSLITSDVIVIWAAATIGQAAASRS